MVNNATPPSVTPAPPVINTSGVGGGGGVTPLSVSAMSCHKSNRELRRGRSGDLMAKFRYPATVPVEGEPGAAMLGNRLTPCRENRG